jgi:hypothetical protein
MEVFLSQKVFKNPLYHDGDQLRIVKVDKDNKKKASSRNEWRKDYGNLNDSG